MRGGETFPSLTGSRDIRCCNLCDRQGIPPIDMTTSSITLTTSTSDRRHRLTSPFPPFQQTELPMGRVTGPCPLTTCNRPPPGLPSPPAPWTTRSSSGPASAPTTATASLGGSTPAAMGAAIFTCPGTTRSRARVAANFPGKTPAEVAALMQAPMYDKLKSGSASS